MKFLPENNRKTLWLTILFVVSLGGIIYLNYFGQGFGKGVKVAPPPTPAASPVAKNQPETATAPAPAGNFQTKNPRSETFPHGTSIGLGILNSEKFKILKVPPALTVASEDLGKTDIFSK